MLQAKPFSPGAASSSDPAAGSPVLAVDPAQDPANPFERLVRIYRSNEVLLGQLRQNETRMAQSRAYLAGPHCNPVLGRARLGRLRERKSCLLARLRANRILVEKSPGIPYVQ